MIEHFEAYVPDPDRGRPDAVGLLVCWFVGLSVCLFVGWLVGWLAIGDW